MRGGGEEVDEWGRRGGVHERGGGGCMRGGMHMHVKGGA